MNKKQEEAVIKYLKKEPKQEIKIDGSVKTDFS